MHFQETTQKGAHSEGKDRVHSTDIRRLSEESIHEDCSVVCVVEEGDDLRGETSRKKKREMNLVGEPIESIRSSLPLQNKHTHYELEEVAPENRTPADLTTVGFFSFIRLSP